MTRRTLSGLLTASVLILAAVFIIRSLKKDDQEKIFFQWRMTFPVMGTVASFTFYTDDEKLAVDAAEKAKIEFQKVTAIANLYDSASELSRLNSTAAKDEFICSPEMWELLMRAKRAYNDSNGAFDVTVKPLMDLWGFYRKRGKNAPSHREIGDALKKVGFDKLKLNNDRRSVRFTVPQMALDFGGIAKGYAADRAAKAVIASGIESGVIDIGGNLILLPEVPPGKKSYTVGIRDPENSGQLLEPMLELPGNCALATSGDYERFVILDGKTYGHIVNPETGYPEANNAVTAVALSALDADIFSTSAYLGKKRCAEHLQKQYPGTRFIFAEQHRE